MVISDDELVHRIMKVLSIYPRISPTMLQVGIGPQIPPRLWHPVLEKLVLENTVQREYITTDSQAGRFKTFTIISRTDGVLVSQPAH